MPRLRNREGIAREIIHLSFNSLLRDCPALRNTWDVCLSDEAREKHLERVSQGLAAALPILIELELVPNSRSDLVADREHEGVKVDGETGSTPGGEAEQIDRLEADAIVESRQRLREACRQLNRAIACAREIGFNPVFDWERDDDDSYQLTELTVESFSFKETVD